MLKRFRLAGVLFAVSAVVPLTVAAQDRNYNNHNQAQWAPQRYGMQVNNPRASGYNNAQNFRGGREPARNTVVYRDGRYSKLRFFNGHNHGPMPFRESDRNVCR